MSSIRSLLLATVVLVVGSPVFGQDDLRELRQRISNALVKGDADFIDEVTAEDFTHVAPSGHFETKAQFLAALRDGSLDYRAMDLQEMMIRVYGDTAVMSTLLQIKVEVRGEQMDVTVRTTEVYVKEDGKWRAVAVQATRVEQNDESRRP